MIAEIIQKVSMSPHLLEQKKVLIRCKDCRYCNSFLNTCHRNGTRNIYPEYYCADAEKKEESFDA